MAHWSEHLVLHARLCAQCRPRLGAIMRHILEAKQIGEPETPLVPSRASWIGRTISYLWHHKD